LISKHQAIRNKASPQGMTANGAISKYESMCLLAEARFINVNLYEYFIQYTFIYM